MTITAHAIHRFQDRFERCSYDAARWGIEAMIDEARGLNLSEVVTLRKAGQWYRGHLYLFHDYSGMLLVIKFDTETDEPYLVTMYQPECLRREAA
jgi:hypothetical protein